MGQNRFGTADLALLADPNCYSRFLITPEQDDRTRGERSIAGGAFEAFIGFIDKGYREHDYLLGRANCWAFLRNEFVLHQSNSLFHDWGTLKDDRRFRIDGESLPIIPLLGHLENVGAAGLADQPTRPGRSSGQDQEKVRASLGWGARRRRALQGQRDQWLGWDIASEGWCVATGITAAPLSGTAEKERT